jgi:predicted phage terminase large subunit-like protein
MSLPEEQRKDFIHASLKPKHMVHIFGRYFFPAQIKSAKYPECHIETLRYLSSPDSCAIIMPRGHAKTTLVRIETIHDIVYHHEELLMFIGPNLTDAKQSFAFIKDHLEANVLLRYVYGNLVPPFSVKKSRKWSDTHFECTNGVIAIARGAGKGRGINIGGKRPTKILIDDMEEKDRVGRDYQRRKIRQWLFEVIIPSVDMERGRFKMVGTVLHYACLLLEVQKKFGGIRKAALQDADGLPSLTGTPLWSYWTPEKLEQKKREMGSFAFAQEYMNDPMSDEDADIKLKWVQWVDEINLFDDKGNMLWRVHSVLDPAVGTKQTNDEAAIVTVAREIRTDKKVNIVVLTCEYGRWGMDKTVTQSQQVYKRYPQSFKVENVGFQEVFRRALTAAGVPASGVNPSSKDKRTRLMEIAPKIEFGEVRFMRACEDLVAQLVQFPNGEHDDRVDAMVYAVQEALGNTGGGFFGGISGGADDDDD